MTENILVGKSIHNIMLAADYMAIKFITNEGDIVAKCDADCCSSTWIQNIELPVNGFPALVSEVTDIPLNEDEDNPDGALSFYGLKISTDKGDVIIDYRNESNGYYGGGLRWPGEYHYGGVDGQNISKEEWRDVTQ